MHSESNVDNKAHAELLCFLVLAQIIGHATTGDWLRTDPCACRGLCRN
jgi:hypothetical protein